MALWVTGKIVLGGSGSSGYPSRRSSGTRDPYEVLGVSRSASPEEIKKAFRRKSLETHPDKHDPSERKAYEQKFKEVNAAWAAIRDGKVDEEPASYETRVIRVPLRVSMEQLLRGGSFTVPLVIPISSYSRVVFAVPAKFEAGACEGDVVSRRLTRELGEICVYLVLKPHRRFAKQGDVLYATKWLPAWAPALRRRGMSYRVVTLKGLEHRRAQISLSIPVDLRDGLRLRATGRGLCLRGRRGQRGDVVVQFRIRSAPASCLRMVLKLAPLIVLANAAAALRTAKKIVESPKAKVAGPILLRQLLKVLAAVFFAQDLRDLAGPPLKSRSL